MSNTITETIKSNKELHVTISHLIQYPNQLLVRGQLLTKIPSSNKVYYYQFVGSFNNQDEIDSFIAKNEGQTFNQYNEKSFDIELKAKKEKIEFTLKNTQDFI